MEQMSLYSDILKKDTFEVTYIHWEGVWRQDTIGRYLATEENSRMIWQLHLWMAQNDLLIEVVATRAQSVFRLEFYIEPGTTEQLYSQN